MIQKLLLILILLMPLWILADEQARIMQALQPFINETPPLSGAHCGFKDLIELRQQIKQVSSADQALLYSMIPAQPPLRQDSVLSPSGRFRLHFDREGRHAVPLEDVSGNGIPDYIDSAAVYLDLAWQVQIEELGFRPPPNPDGQPVGIYPIYFTNFGYYGLTTYSEIDIPSLPGINYTSYIELHNNYESAIFYSKGLQGLKVTIAHEFNHAIQLGYNFRLEEDLYFMEMTSTWMENVMFSEVNDYIFYLDSGGPTRSFFKNIYSISFTSTNNFDPYANCLYLHMLEALFGPQIVVDIWEQIIAEESFSALHTVLERKAWSFPESQNRYAGWLYFTGSRSLLGQYFPEALLYPEIEINQGKESFALGLEKLAIRHIQLQPEYNRLVGAQVSSGQEKGRFSHILNEQQLLESFAFNNEQIFSTRQNEPIVVVLSNPADAKITDLAYQISPKAITAGPDPVLVQVGNEQIRFKNLPGESKIVIFNLNGTVLRQIDHQLPDGQEALWDLRDRNGHRVASGVYLYHIRAAGFEDTGKFSVIRK